MVSAGGAVATRIASPKDVVSRCQPFGPLPTGVGVAGVEMPLLPSLHVLSRELGVRSITPSQRLRDATALIFNKDIDDSLTLVQPCVTLCSAFASACGVNTCENEAGVYQALLKAEVTVTLNFGIPAAVQWADNFVFPSEVWQRDGLVLQQHHMSLESMLYAFHEERRARYLSPESVMESLGPIDDPRFVIPLVDRMRLVELATLGMVVQEPPGFRPCPSPPEFRRSYLAVSTTVDKLFYKQWLIGSMLIIPTEMAQRIPGIHFGNPSWAVKAGAPQGRNVHDISYCEEPEHILNGTHPAGRSWLQAKCEARWGQIRLPDLQAIMQTILRVIDREGIGEVVLWAKDLKGAFTLLRFHPSQSRLFALGLECGLTTICPCGNFGWVGTPYAFNVVSRTLDVITSHTISGAGVWYVDDLNACSNKRTFEHDMRRIDEEVRTLLGPESMAADKDKSGRQLDMIGWLIDLDAQLVTISDRNFHKTLHAFFSFDIEGTVTLHQVQVMASLASRYTQINVLMKVHVGALYEFQATFRSHNAQRRLPTAARVEVLLWRAFLLSLSINPAAFARSFASFRERKISHTIEYDASLTGMGVLVWEGDLQEPRRLLGFAVLPSLFAPTTDSSFQNTYEYMAILLGLLLTKSLRLRDCVFIVHGDSRSSLAWVLKGRARSALCRRASIGFSILAVNVAATIKTTEYITSKDNFVCDGLSRGVDPSELGLDPQLQMHLSTTGPTAQYIRQCDPLLPMDTWAQLIDHMGMCHQLLSRV